MDFVKIQVAGGDYIVADIASAGQIQKENVRRLLERRSGVGGEGLVLVSDSGADDETKVSLYLPSGEEAGEGVCAAIAAAKWMLDRDFSRKKVRVSLCGRVYPIQFSMLGGRVLCAWTKIEQPKKRKMEEQKYYYGRRGEILRDCLRHPRLGIYDLAGQHALFFLESCTALRALDIAVVCRRLQEALFFGTQIQLHFAAIAGDNALALRSFKTGIGEIFASGEGAAAAAAAAEEEKLTDVGKVMIKCRGGTLCAESAGEQISLCAKCESVFRGEIL